MSAELPKMPEQVYIFWSADTLHIRLWTADAERAKRFAADTGTTATVYVPEQAAQEAARQAMEQLDHLQLLFNASKLGHEQAFASSQRAHSALSALQRDLNIMLASAVPEGGEWIEGYRVKTGALHRIIGTMQEAGYSVVLPALTNESEKRHG